MAKRNYDNWIKEELIREVEKLEKKLKKNYGLVWEDKLEDVAQLCKEKLPVLLEDKSKEIISDSNKPTDILIEGDNYHVLSVLNYTHKGKIDVIYIDPPYNTGNKDFKYNDTWVDSEDSYRHSKWLSFMEKRLKLAKSLLKINGGIFISIDSIEIAQLKLMCDEIFGARNFVNIIVWKKTNSPKSQSNSLGNQHEYVLFYAKNLLQLKINKFVGQIDERYKESFKNDDNDGRGPYQTVAIVAAGTQRTANRKSFDFHGVTDQWLYKKETLEQWWKDGRIYKTGGGKYRLKKYLSETEGRLLSDIWIDDEIKALQGGSSEYMGFVTQKPLSLIKRVCKLFHDKSIVLDFFAGSGTTGEAVVQLNKEDNGGRKFILCTNNEDSGGEKHRIAEDICYPRLKNVLKKFKGQLKYFKTAFVDAKSTDRNKKKLVNKSTEMLCLKEDCFDEVEKGSDFKIFKSSQNKYLGIIYDDDGIESFKKEAKKMKKKFVVYVFSLDESAREEEFEDMANMVQLKPIPAVILNVYKRIFK